MSEIMEVCINEDAYAPCSRVRIEVVSTEPVERELWNERTRQWEWVKADEVHCNSDGGIDGHCACPEPCYE